jgi:hypothetical protein
MKNYCATTSANTIALTFNASFLISIPFLTSKASKPHSVSFYIICTMVRLIYLYESPPHEELPLLVLITIKLFKSLAIISRPSK